MERTLTSPQPNVEAPPTVDCIAGQDFPNRSGGWVIAKASTGVYDPTCLRWAERAVPTPRPGQVTVRTTLLSVDPTTRNWLKLDPNSMYIPLAVGDVMIGAATGVVVATADPAFSIGDHVGGMWGWEQYSTVETARLEKHIASDQIPDSAYLSIFSHIGRAAAIGLYEIARISKNDTVVVSGAAGATGSIAVQIAKDRGCRVVALAGGPDKCRYVTDDLGVDCAIDYKSDDVAFRLAEACPLGIDVYFDNVGGPILDAVLDNMATGCRIALCGAMSQYNIAGPGDAYGIINLPNLLFKRAKIQGFVVPDFAADMSRIDAILTRLYADGTLSVREHIVEGLAAAPEAVQLLFSGENTGKLLVRV
ncbi:NADP-dependent oxidoreductase [Rhodococcoides fascians]|uniref:NADP-dependent oxidoreductase n=1 Tax=Rhodococcoides fascians TaxID=1828 RepID=UPI00111488B5|nr:NADP-dependent oxidoreductase [Rhodococcus fascians]